MLTASLRWLSGGGVAESRRTALIAAERQVSGSLNYSSSSRFSSGFP